MTYLLLVRPTAEDQIIQAYEWYEEKSKGLGDDFILSIDACFQHIIRNPFSFQVRYKGIRVGLLRKFPYGIFYLIDKNKIIVLSILHFRQNPSKWKKIKK